MTKVKLTGRVVHQHVGGLSKSAREAAVLQSHDGNKYILRVQGGNPFYDSALEPFVGQLVSLRGKSVDGGIVVVDKISDITVIHPKKRPPQP